MWNKTFLLLFLAAHLAQAQYSSRVLSVTTVPTQPQGPNLEAIRASGIKASGNVFQVVPNVGVLFKGMGFVPGQVTKSIPDPSLLHPGKERTIVVNGEKAVPLGNGSDDIVFVVCPTQNLADGSPVSGMIYPCGTYAYINAMNTQRTVLRYAPSAEEAYKILVSGK